MSNLLMETEKRKIRILMLPWLAHGHIPPFLELGKQLSNTHYFHIYFCSTPIILNSINPNHHHLPPTITLVQLHLPSNLPPHYHTTNALPPHLIPTLKRAFDLSSSTFSTIINTIKPDLLIYDFLQPWAPSLASLHSNIPSILFLTTGAALSSYMFHLLKNPSSKFPFSTLYLHEYEHKKTISSLEGTANDIKDSERVLECIKWSTNIVLIKSFREIEGKYIDYLSALSGKRHIPVGPLVQDSVIEDHDDIGIIEWLDKKDERSMVLVSFGSEYFLSKEEIEEVGHGLELSGVNFIWVIRFPIGERIAVEEALPKGFLERVGERGRVVERWVAQQRILGHSSISGFVSHCGWSSVMEGMEFGIPIIAMPMQLDQPLNARLVEEVGVGKEAVRDANGRLEREEIARVIREVVMEETGVKLRREAKILSDKMKEKVGKEIDEVVEELIKLCRI